MADQYKTKSTSATSAIVEDICLSENTQFKKVVRAEIVSNPHDSSASVSVTLLVQKASSKNKFEDLPEQSLIKLQAKDIVKLSLKSAETKKLYNELGNLYQIYEKEGVPRGDNELVVASADDVIVTDKNKALIIKKLISQNLSEELWQQLIDSDPDLATKLSLSRLQQNRSKTLVSFESMLSQDLTEPEWQCFFEQNAWIFGYGLNFSNSLQAFPSRPHYGVTSC
ncbi:MAG: hypothetical protein IPJ69_02300 [Deltaproteobacteria bacterium]|nr:MAG: hypothetical protein IPJ69_02300 [Deltaproteobacteria bacterium]